MAAGAQDKFTKSYSFLQKSLAATINDTDNSLTLNNYTNIPTDTKVHFIIDRIDSNGNRTNTTRELVSGICTGSAITNLARGLHSTTAQSHSSGAIVEFVLSGAAWNDLVDGILSDHDQAGYHSKTLKDSNGNEWLEPTTTTSAVNHVGITNAATGNGPSITAKGTDSNVDLNITPKGTGNVVISSLATDGWANLQDTPDTITYNGNRSYTAVFNSNDLTDTLSEGMRVRLTRTVSAPTQCADLEASSSQYFNDTSLTGISFTDDFACGAWVKLESYTTSYIISRYNGTSGWGMFLNSSGQIGLIGFNGGSGNFSQVLSYQSVPLNKWVHISAQLDMSAFTATTTTSYVMIDGVDVPAVVSRGGTNPTALVQAGNLEIGSLNGGTNPYDGKLAQVWVSSAKVTQANVRALMSQGLTTADTSTYSLASAYSLSNSLNDLNTTNANNLTANGGAAATNVDSPFGNYLGGTLEYAVISSKPTFSTNTTVTLQVPEGCAIPTSGGVSAVAYSSQDTPYGFPRNKGQWLISSIFRAVRSQASPVSGTVYNLGQQITAPVGNWVETINVTMAVDRASAGILKIGAGLNTVNNLRPDVTDVVYAENSNGNTSLYQNSTISTFQSYSSQTIKYLNIWTDQASMSTIYFLADRGPVIIMLENAYL